MFNLEQAITEWRQRSLASGIKAPVPLEELESHLRDDIEAQIQSGLSAEQAFHTAVSHFGETVQVKQEFAKIGGIKQVLKQKAVWVMFGIAFAGCGFEFGHSPALALVYGVVLAGLIVATIIDFKHYIIPDQITLGGMVAGLLCSSLWPALQGQKLLIPGMGQSLLGMGVGAGVLYMILRLGKLAFGREQIVFAGESRIIFTDTVLQLPEKEIAYAELFYRKSDAVTLQARTVALDGRTYQDVSVRLTANSLHIGNDQFPPAEVARLVVVSSAISLPREAMGFGDVKLMAAIGAFLGWQAVVFSLAVSSLLGSLAGLGLVVARRRELSARLPYGPYIALAAAIWIFGGQHFLAAMFAP